MIKFIVNFAFFAIVVRTFPQDNYFRFALVTPNTSVNEIEFVEPTTEMSEEAMVEPTNERQEESPQCLYDFNGNRINKGCPINERPPMCAKGFLVQTLVGSDYELCCCNYSNVQ